MENLFNTSSILPLLSLLTLLLITSFDNVSFLSNAVSKISPRKQRTSLFFGVVISLLFTFVLLWAVTQFTFFNQHLFTIRKLAITPRFLLLFLGGIIIFANYIVLIINLLQDKVNFSYQFSPKETILAVIGQIALFNFAFSLDSILISIGLVGNLNNALILIITAFSIYSFLMIFFADDISNLLENSKTIRIIGYGAVALLAFVLILYSFNIMSFSIF